MLGEMQVTRKNGASKLAAHTYESKSESRRSMP
jgi:hypothetical protein